MSVTDFDIDEAFFTRLDRISHSELLDIDYIFNFLFDIQFEVKENKDKNPILKLSELNKQNLSSATMEVIQKVFYIVYHFTKFISDNDGKEGQAYGHLHDSYNEIIIELLHSIIMARFGLIRQAYQPLRRVLDAIILGGFVALTSIDLKQNLFTFMLYTTLDKKNKNVWNILHGQKNKEELRKKFNKKAKWFGYKSFYKRYFSANKLYCKVHHRHSGSSIYINEDYSITDLSFHDNKTKNSFVCYKLQNDKNMMSNCSYKAGQQRCNKPAVFVHIINVPSMEVMGNFINDRLKEKETLDKFLKIWLRGDEKLLHEMGISLNSKKALLKQLWSQLSIYVHANPITHQHTVNFDEQSISNFSEFIDLICDVASVIFLSCSLTIPSIEYFAYEFIGNIKYANKDFVDKYPPNQNISELLSKVFTI